MVVIKPDGVKKKLTGLCIHEIEKTGARLIAAKVLKPDVEKTKLHYAHLKDREFFNELIEYFTGETHGVDEIPFFVFAGDGIIKKIRVVVGATNPLKADKKSIRGKYGRVINGRIENIIHASTSPLEAIKEIKLWFKKHEIPDRFHKLIFS